MEIGGGLSFRVFEKFEGDGFSVFRDKSCLMLSCVPDVVVRRGREEDYFARILAEGVRDDFLPPMIRVFGRPGGGKTVVVRSVLKRFQDHRGDVFRFFYVNLRGCRTVFSAANAVLDSICGLRLASNLGLIKVFDRVWRELRELVDGVRFVCLVLDEIDSIFMDRNYSPSDFFYRFLRYHEYIGDVDIRLCLITIMNKVSTFDGNVDARVRSSMGAEMIVFPSYTVPELYEILSARAEQAFKPGLLDEEVLVLCSKLVRSEWSDARRAIDLLRVSGDVANERRSKVDVSCVEEAYDRIMKDWMDDLFRSLSLSETIVMLVMAFISKQKEVFTSQDLYRHLMSLKLDERIHELMGGKLLKERRILDVLRGLETLGLVSTWKISRGRYGYMQEIRLEFEPDLYLSYLEADKRLKGT